MTVGLITYSTKPRGGVVHTLDLAEELLRQGEDVEIVALGNEEKGFFRQVDVPTHFIEPPERADTLDERVFRSVDALAYGLAPLANRFDVLHAQDCIAARACSRIRDQVDPSIRVVRTVHHVDDFTTEALVDCQRQSIAEPDHLIVVSEMWRRILLDDYQAGSTVIFNGVNFDKVAAPQNFDRDKVRRSASIDDRFLFLTVGGIEPRKGTLEIVEAVALLKERMERPPLVAIIGGHSFQDHTPYRNETLNRAETLGVSMDGGDIVQLGTVTDAELAEWYHAADAFLFPSVKEGWGLVAMEALAAGLPLIASDIPVFREYLVDGETAVLVPPHDADSLATTMEQLVKDEQLRDALSRNGRAGVAAFTWQRAATEHRNLYRWVRGDS